MSGTRTAALWLLLALPQGVAAQTLPGYSAPKSGAEGEWLLHTRALAERSMQDWINLMLSEGRGHLAKLFTDRAVLLHPGGPGAEGRGAIDGLVKELPPRRELLVQVTGVTAGIDVMNVTGRVAYRAEGKSHFETFAAVLEQQRDFWLYRLLAFAPLADNPAAATLEDALGADRSRPRLPELATARFVVEPSMVRGPNGIGAGDQPWIGAGLGIGVELDRTLELRVGAWRGGDVAETPLRAGGPAVTGYSTELRVYVLPSRPVRPYLAAGLAKLKGPVPDSAIVPQLGTGVAIRMWRGLDLQVSMRDYLVAADAALYPSSSWFTRKREHRGLFALGLSYATGRDAVWRDPELSAMARAQQARELPAVLATMHTWADAVSRGHALDVQALYAAPSVLYRTEGDAVHAAEDIAAFWVSAVGPVAVTVQEARVSGAAAWVELLLTDATGVAMRVFSTLVRTRAGWHLQHQVLH